MQRNDLLACPAITDPKGNRKTAFSNRWWRFGAGLQDGAIRVFKAPAAQGNGREIGKVSLRRTQFRLAQGNASMAIQLVKQYLGQDDKTKLELTGESGGPVETVDLSKLDTSELRSLKRALTRAKRSTT